MVLERERDDRRSKHADVSTSEEMLAAAYWAIAGRTMRTRPTLNDPCTGSKRSGFAHAQGRAGSMKGATWAMNVVIFLRNGTCQRHAGQRSNLRLRVRSGDIELVVSEIASLSSIARCSLLSATSAHKDKGDVRAEAVVGAMIWPDMRRAQYHIHAPHLCLIDRRHFLREMMAERCA
ncbi:[NiFe]-hydrogenase assembly chaperone HybE [Bradyrhizobium pachyrhizi]|uniref:[NiFe]-hydrogenase assembly chaperone HybE n=1 Tax=Bradyrhizobium pachyrhizi TaxID=280333 RepID=UPI00067A9D39